MSYHWNQIGLTIKIYWKQKMGTPTSKSCEPLIAEDDYDLTFFVTTLRFRTIKKN